MMCDKSFLDLKVVYFMSMFFRFLVGVDFLLEKVYNGFMGKR